MTTKMFFVYFLNFEVQYLFHQLDIWRTVNTQLLVSLVIGIEGLCEQRLLKSFGEYCYSNRGKYFDITKLKV